MDVAQLSREKLAEIVQQQASKIALLEQHLRLLLSKQYGRRSETLSPDQYALFDQGESTQEESSPEEAENVIVTYERKARGKRTPCDEALERQRIDYELPAEQRHCACGGELEKIGEVISEHYEIIPARYLVVEHAQHKYACPCCKQNIQLAPKPASLLPKSNAGPGLLAHIATSKYVDGVPLHRQEAQHERHGIHLPRNTAARWLIQINENDFTPLINLLEEAIRAGPNMHCDETPQQVLKEPGRNAESLSHMWVRLGGLPDRQVVLYTYHTARSSQVAKQLFEDYQGYVQCDGYAAYRCLEQQGIQLVGCFAHARRKFNNALKALGKHDAAHKSKAGKALSFIRKLYAIEADAKADSPEARYQRRQTKALPLLAEFKDWLDQQSVPPQSELGKAILYTQRQWSKLIGYCEAGHLDIDNNANERAIRPFAIGRKNFLFADTPKGAHTNARFYSLIETCKLHGHEPYAYLKHLFKELPKATTVDDYEALLPWNLDAQSLKEGARGL